MEKVLFNSSVSEGISSPIFDATFVALMIVSALTVATNSFILVIFWKEKRLRTYSNYYIINISISDLLVGLVCMPLRSTIYLYEQGWVFGDVCSSLFFTCQNTVLCVSVLGVMVICIDRYIATFYPLQHLKYKTKKTATIVNILTWVAAAAFWIPITIVWDSVKPTNLRSSSGFARANYELSLPANIAVICARLVIPFVTISILYTKIYTRIRQMGSDNVSRTFQKAKEVHHNSQHSISASIKDQIIDRSEVASVSARVTGRKESVNMVHTNAREVAIELVEDRLPPRANQETMKGPTPPTSCNDRKSQRVSAARTSRRRADPSAAPDGSKAMRTLTFIALALFVTWLPNCVNLVLVYTVIGFINSSPEITEWGRWATFANSLVNPVAYALAQPLIRSTARRMLCKRSSCE